MTVRRYLIVAVIVAVIVFVMSYFFYSPFFTVLVDARARGAAALGPVAEFVVNPLIWVLDNPVLGAVVAGLVWPMLLVWIAALFLVILVGFGSPSATEVRGRL
jgi:hypothetical protein